MVVGLVKVFDFSGKKPGFSEIKEICLNLTIGFASLIQYYQITKQKKQLVRKIQFHINHASQPKKTISRWLGRETH